ncbi:hypothetical protein BDR06DRAFT_900074, partial [Suillus hirtellus]
LQEYHYLKVNYESTVDWKLATDYLWCNTSFCGHERYNWALIHTLNKDRNNKNIFVRILFIFKYTVGNKSLDLTLVFPMDTLSASSEFVSLHSIICGALLVSDFNNDGDFFLIDFVDPDMFLHSQRKLLF